MKAMAGTRRAPFARQAGSTAGERLIAWATVLLLVGLLASAFDRSLAAGVALTALAAAAGGAVLAWGLRRDRRQVEQRAARCREALARAAAPIDAEFVGEGGTAALGVVAGAGRLYHAHGYPAVRTDALAFGEIDPAFARHEPGRGYRLEARGRCDGVPARFGIWTARREEAERWVAALAPHLGRRAKWIEEPGNREGEP